MFRTNKNNVYDIYKLALDISDSRIMISDNDLNIIYLNKSMINFIEYFNFNIKLKIDFNISDIIGKNIDFFHKNASGNRDIIRSIGENLKTNIIIGDLLFGLNIIPLRGADQAPLAFMVIWEDASLLDMRGQIRAIDRSMSVVQFDMNGRILDANENFLRTVGYSLAEIKGKHHGLFVEESYRNSPAYQDFWKRLKMGEYQSGRYKRLGKGGREVWLEASYSPILDLHERPFKVVKYAVDITERQRLIKTMSVQVTELVKELSGAATELRTAAEGLSGVATETSDQSIAVSAASEQLSHSVSEIARQLEEASHVMKGAMEEVGNSERLMDRLARSVENIGAVTDLIEKIAGQTNLLALNASIEAARAGEMGKGFTIVANEVKILATQTSKATREINAQVKEVQQSSQISAAAIQKITSVVSRIRNINTAIAGAVEAQSTATSEVARNISSVNGAAGETERMSGSVLDVAGHLSSYACNLDVVMQQFLAHL